MEGTAGRSVNVPPLSCCRLITAADHAGKAATHAVSVHGEKVVSRHSCQITCLWKCLTSCFVTDIILQGG